MVLLSWEQRPVVNWRNDAFGDCQPLDISECNTCNKELQDIPERVQCSGQDSAVIFHQPAEHS